MVVGAGSRLGAQLGYMQPLVGPGLPHHMIAECKGEHPKERGWEERDEERKREGEDQACIAFKDLASEFTLHHFYYILSIRYESRHLAHIKGGKLESTF